MKKISNTPFTLEELGEEARKRNEILYKQYARKQTSSCTKMALSRILLRYAVGTILKRRCTGSKPTWSSRTWYSANWTSRNALTLFELNCTTGFRLTFGEEAHNERTGTHSSRLRPVFAGLLLPRNPATPPGPCLSDANYHVLGDLAALLPQPGHPQGRLSLCGDLSGHLPWHRDCPGRYHERRGRQRFRKGSLLAVHAPLNPSLQTGISLQ
jgi:hypothetical protein